MEEIFILSILNIVQQMDFLTQLRHVGPMGAPKRMELFFYVSVIMMNKIKMT